MTRQSRAIMHERPVSKRPGVYLIIYLTIVDTEGSTPMSSPESPQPPVVGIGACLVGQPVRYNGSHKRASDILAAMERVMELRPFCPELAIGLGVPREPIRIVAATDGQRAMDSATQQQDYTEPLQVYADQVGAQSLSGYIFVKGSPSCGYQRVKLYDSRGNNLRSEGVGVFARRLMRNNPLLPVEEEGRLNDVPLRERFIRRVYAYHDWQRYCGEAPLSHHRLIEFYSRYKYLVMAHHPETYKRIGRLLAQPERNVQRQANKLIALLMYALSHPARRGAYANALSHLKGYLKRDINAAERQLLDGVIEDYRRGKVPLVVPVRMLEHYFALYPNDYVGRQAFFYPYPDELGVRNHMV